MPDWVLWVVAVVAAVAAGWLWSEWRGRATRRPSARDARPGRTGTRPADRRRSGGPGRTTAPPRPRGAERPTAEPRPGEIWWADVPYADGTGSKVRPCLVVHANGRGADVLKITSQDKSGRDDHVRIPTRDWDADADHDSWLDLAEPLHITADAFSNRAGTCDPDLWRQVRRLHGRPSPA